MVSKKLLSLFGLAATSIKLISAIALTNCSDLSKFSGLETNYDIDTVINYCIDSDKRIWAMDYKYKYPESYGFYVFKIQNAYRSSKINLIDQTTEITFLDQLALYYCSDGKCNQTYGYIKDRTGTPNYYSVSSTKAAEKVTTMTDCDNSGDSTGLISSSGVCLTSTDAYNFNDDENYIMDKPATGSPFGTGDNARVVNVGSYHVVLNPFFTENVYTQSTRKIVSVADNLNSVSIVKKLYSCTNGSCTSAKSTIEAPKKYIIKVSNNYFKLVSTAEDSGNIKFTDKKDFVVMKNTGEKDNKFFEAISDGLDGIETISSGGYSLYDCETGECYLTAGFFKYSSGSVASCTRTGTCTTYTQISECSATNVGKVKYESELKICVDASTLKGEGFTFVTVDTGIYTIYKKNTRTNIMVNSLIPEYYLIKGGVVVDDTDEEEGELVECINGTCTKKEVYGYYINAAEPTDTSKKYIKCEKDEENTKCVLMGNLTGSCNDNTDSGKLVTNAQFCQNFVDSAVQFEFGSYEGDYVVLRIDNNIFEVESGTYYLVTATTNSITLKTGNVKLPTCTESSGKCRLTATGTPNLSAGNYCITSEGKIYVAAWDKSDGTCSVAFGKNGYDEGLLVFDVSSPNYATYITPRYNSLSYATLVIYDCAYGVCTQTYGYVRDNDGKLYLCTTTGSGEYTGPSALNVKELNGQINQGINVGILSDIAVNDSGSTPAYASVTVTGQHHFIIKPEATPSDGYIGDFKYSNIGLLKTEEDVVALTMNNPQLPTCNNKCELDGTTLKINDGGSCITSEGVIYERVDTVCSAKYGMESTSTGVKVFQKQGEFNEYKDVTSVLDTVVAIAPEVTPMFVIYDCTSDKCTQTSGFVKYGSTPEFMNCYTQANLAHYPEGNIYPFGCVKLYADGGENCDYTRMAKAVTGSCKFTPATNTFSMYFSPWTSATNHDDADVSNKYVFTYMSMVVDHDKVVLFKNDQTPFPDTKSGDNVLVKIDGQTAVVSKTVTKGYYVNAGSVYSGADSGKDALIYCKSEKIEECTVYPVTQPTYNAETSVPGYYINSGPDAYTKPLIYCDGDDKKCVSEVAENGYYVNADKNETSKKLIRCSNGVCEAVAADSSCGVGRIIKSGSNYVLCTGSSTDGALTLGTVAYQSLTIGANGFPGVSAAGTIDVKVTAKKSVVLMEENVLPACDGHPLPNAASRCTSSEISVGSCILDDIIYVSNGVNCVPITGTTGKEIFYFDDKYYTTTEPDGSEDDAYLAYQCTFDGDVVKSCEKAKGYSIIDDGAKSIVCNGWKGEKCVYSAASGANCESNDQEGNLITSKKLCFTESMVGLPSAITTVAFEVSKSNAIYGIGSGVAVLTVSEGQSFVNTKAAATAQPAYYLNRNYRSGVATSKTLIKCANGSCTAENGEVDVKYMDAGDSTAKSLITCTAADTACTSAVVESGMYVDGADNKKTITCTGNGCISTTSITLCKEGVASGACQYGKGTTLPTNHYCIKSSDQKIYKSSEDACTAQEESILFFKANADGLYEASKLGEAGGLIYTCNASHECTQLRSTYYLYVYDMNDDDAETNLNYLYRCDENGMCVVKNSIKAGYYLEGAATNDVYASLIHCKSNEVQDCEHKVIQTTTEPTDVGYYIDAGNPGNIIHCSAANACSSAPGTTDQGVAYLDRGSAVEIDTSPKYKIVQLIQCSDNGCTSTNQIEGLYGTNTRYFIDGAANTNVITCDKDKCETTDLSGSDATTTYLDGSNINYTITCPAGYRCTSSVECRVNTGVGCLDKTYYLIAKDDKNAIINLTTSTGELYYCLANEGQSTVSCEVVKSTGYFINSVDEIYRCKGGNCSKYTLSGSCGAKNYGKVYLEHGKIALCLDASHYALPSSTTKNYMVLYDGGSISNTLGASDNDKRILVKVGENSFTVDEDYTFTKDKFVYISSLTYRVMEYGVCPSVRSDITGEINIIEYQCADAQNCKQITVGH